MMSIRGSSLAAASEVNQFSGWRDCKRHLTEIGVVNRGLLPVWRTQVQPQHITAPE